MTAHAQTLETVIGSAVGLIGLGSLAVRKIVKPLNRMADRVETAVQVVEGTPAHVVNGFVIRERQPGVVERFSAQQDAIARIERGVEGLYPRVETLERIVTRTTAGQTS